MTAGSSGGASGLGPRLVRLYVGLVGFGASVALMVEADLGLSSWDVLHQGVAERAGIPLGWMVIAVSVVVLLLWVPLRQRPGLGTLSNVIVVGLAVDATLGVLPTPHGLPLRMAFLVSGIVANGVATGLYIGAGLGPGPRDGLMTGLAERGHSIRRARTVIELIVLATGFALGGTVGVGTVAYALAIGPLAQVFLPLFTVTDRGARESVEPRPVSRPRRSAGGVNVGAHHVGQDRRSLCPPPRRLGAYQAFVAFSFGRPARRNDPDSPCTDERPWPRH